ncbi:Inositol 2-dehydrogenase [Pseudobythopirellula maris]|uniref:Inositol 2-dehydrogenase n=1 Tax=Pseudobythopirellula maris TaxID=2527991 RepID=A0A5C5ZNT7_9BACT|nr:Gfo/Idh/MocA family oxidoreductase [Pseudobythopirellula maris]TWT88796.1 Inositol 2-dehydrogenase [Pseudobythopirellula maris]
MSIDRRDFLSATAAAAALTALGPVARAATAPSDVRMAVIGFKGRGKSHIEWFNKNLVALCDVDQDVLAKANSKFGKDYGRELDTETDYRRLLERDDIDAVSIATPNHTHSLIAIAAIEAGKDVYVEKPVSHNIWEGRQLVAAARKHNRIVQCGTQSRSSKCLQEAVAYVQSGALGKIQYALGTCYKARPSIGKRDTPLPIPGTVDYDLWCGPADKVDLYRTKLHYDWHWDTNTGNGDMGNQGIHQMDIARWFLGEKQLAPRAISVGGRLGYDDAGNTPNSQTVLFDYKAAPLLFETRGLPVSKAGQKQWGRSMGKFRGSQIGVIVQCEDGYVFAGNSYSSATAYDNRGEQIKHWTGSGDPAGNFLAGVEARDPSILNAEIQEGHLSSALCHQGMISHQVGEKARTEEIAERFAANPLMSASVDRLFGHLRANGIDIDSGDGALTLGADLELDTATETFTNNDAAAELSKRIGRDSFQIPDYGV